MTKTLLPVGSSQLEQKAAQICALAEHLNVDYSILWNADKCPEPLLPFLAWALSVDYWEENWNQEKKREVIRNAFRTHKYKGTISAIKRAIEPFGYVTDLTEWFEETPSAQAGTFRLSIEVPASGLTEKLNKELLRLIDNTKPVSRTLRQLIITLTNICDTNTASTITTGTITTIYPKD
ncbi:tail protein [Gallibacterium genomosp. 3]|uniref:Tail protein n=1 Tax=Gallibacterium genomosp. 3 TaxID=505345 RepID=A0A1A7PW40_9PAST|nr:phage tail protein I [Gallibacterium genomosp. 3]OBX05937.1 tail protein [Gallibacterium genomosp. 3]